MDDVLVRINGLLGVQRGRTKELAEYLGYTNANVVSDWRAGRSKSYMKQLPKIAEFLDTTVAYLTGQTDNPYPTERNVNATVFYERYLELCASVDKTPSGAALEMGLSKPTVNRWKNGGGITDATARKVAAYFDVPVDYLTGQTDDPAPEQKEKAPLSDVDRLMEGLNAESIRKLREYAELLLLGQEKEEKEKE